ncbi:MAG TPA: rhomboid family intramembrane serine protease [Rhodanobacteraceae bacterium]
MNPALQELLLGIGLASAFVAGLLSSRNTAPRGVHSVPVLTLACFIVIAGFSITQLAFNPALLPLLMRDAAFVHSGQAWRLLTSLLVQDGGWAGAGFNLVGLLAIGALAERLLGRLRWATIAVISVATAQSAALFWQPVGAGNSILDFGLAGAAVATSFMIRPAGRALVPALVASACFLILLLARDIHGAAATTGALVACVFRLTNREHV